MPTPRWWRHCRRRATDAYQRDHARTGEGPPGRRDVILQLLRASAEPRSIASVANAGRAPEHGSVSYRSTAARWPRRTNLGNSAGRGRPPILFRASRRMDPTGPTNYRLLASILTGYVARRPDAAGIAAQLGRSTSPALVASSPHPRAPSKTRAVTELVALLAELGFEPEPADGRRTREIRLRHCPFQNLAEQHGEVICSLHLGLIQGALTAMLAHLVASDDPLFVAEDAELGLTGRMVVAVRSGRELMGSVWVACSAPLHGAARTALADGARTVALHLLRSRAAKTAISSAGR